MTKDSIDLIDKLEDFKETRYKDIEGNVSVGYGFNMDNSSATRIWYELNIMEDFDLVYSGAEILSHFSATLLLDRIWSWAENKAIARCIEVGRTFNSLPDFHRFILADIVYNTGSINHWYNVIVKRDPKDILFEARRRDDDGGHSLDSRIAKIGYHFKIINSIEEAKELGLDEAKYLS